MIVTALLLLGLLLATALPVAVALIFLGMSLSSIYSMMPLTRVLGEITWTSSSNFLLLSIPLFVLLGELLLRSGLADRMYNAMVQWLSWLPGGLMHANIGSCALFAATCGSSAATAATIGTLSLPQCKRNGYQESLFLGSLAAGGTLGILIPPSINMIVYGAITETSVPRLYLAGIVPGLMLSGLFMAVIIAACLRNPGWGGRPVETTWKKRIAVLPDLLPPLFIFFVIIGSIYRGYATATESAALGVVATFVLALLHRRISIKMLVSVLLGTMKTTSMIMFIIMASFFLNFVMASIGLTTRLNAMIVELHLSPMVLLLCVVAFYVILGCFLETLSMMVTTLPIITPIMVSAGFDPVWFGVIIIILVEMALITPPVGLNLYIIQGIRQGGSINDVIIGSLPFVLAMFVMIALLALFPQLALELPNLAFAR